jgi:hypothetical protein
MTRATGRVAPPVRTASTVRAGTAGPRTSPRSGSRAAPRPGLRLVPWDTTVSPRRRAARALRNPRATFVLLVVAMLVGTTIGLLILNTAIAVDSLKATELRAGNAERAQDVQRLQQQVVSGGTPAEIARAAVASGLVPAGPAAYLVIDPDGGSVLRGTPTPAEGAPAPAAPAPAESAPAPAESTPAPAESAPAEDTPAEGTPAEDTPAEDGG